MMRTRWFDTIPTIFGLATMVVLGAILEALIRGDVISPFIVPPPSLVIGSLSRVITEENIVQRFLQTAGEGIGAGILITLIGVPAGLVLHRWTTLRLAVSGWIAASTSAPVVLAYPLFLVIFGRSAATIIVIGFCSGVAPVILKTLEGLNATRPTLLNVGRSLKLTPLQQFRYIAFPSALPVIVTGIRLGLILALINVIGVELLINFGGLGQLINELSERYDLPGTYAAIGFVLLVSVLLFVTLDWIERWLRPR
jgi:NitT/TauT family transport system permease protein